MIYYYYIYYYYTGNITSIRHHHSDCIAVFKYKSITCLKVYMKRKLSLLYLKEVLKL